MANQTQPCPYCRERCPLVTNGAHVLGCQQCYRPRMLRHPRTVRPATVGYTLQRVA